MRTKVKLKPGEKGTKGLLKQYGEALVCVRYRYDETRKKQIKTVELVVSESDWTPPPPKYTASSLVGLKIGINEKNLQQQVKALGGQWDPKQQVWLVRYICIAKTNLEKLIVI
jgi:hypothetical protein